MDFDLSTAKPVEDTPSVGFDINSARPVESKPRVVYDQESEKSFSIPDGYSEGEIGFKKATEIDQTPRENFFGGANIGSPIDLARGYMEGLVDSAVSLATFDESGVEKRLEAISRKEAIGKESDFYNWIMRPASERGFEKEKAKLNSRLSEIESIRASSKTVQEAVGVSTDGSFLGNVGRGGQSLVQSMGLATITGSATAATAIFSMQQKTTAYREARDAGFDVEDSDRIAEIRSITTGAIEAVGVGQMSRLMTSAPIKRALGGFITNAAEEGSQEFADIMITNEFGQTDIDLGTGAAQVAYASLVGGIVGAPVSVVMGGNSQALADMVEQTGVTEAEIMRIAKSVEVLVDGDTELKDTFSGAVEQIIADEVGGVKSDPKSVAEAMEVIEKFESGIEITADERNAISQAGENQVQAASSEVSAQVESDISSVAAIQEQIEAVRSFIKTGKGRVIKKPFIDYLKKQGKVRVDSVLAKELDQMGINHKTAPGLFKKDGTLGDVDNFVLSELRDIFPNNALASEDGTFVDRDYILEQISQETFNKDSLSQEDVGFDKFIEELDKLALDIDNVTAEQLFEAIEGRPPLKEETDDLAGLVPLDLDKIIADQGTEFADAADKAIEFENNEALFFEAPKPPSYLARVSSEFGLGVERTLTPISTRVKNISRKLFNRLRKFEFDTKVAIIADKEAVVPLLRKIRDLPADVQATLDLAMKNSNTDVIDSISETYGLKQEFADFRVALDGIFDRAGAAGIELNYLDNLFPRRVKDLDGLLDFIGVKDGTSTIINEALKSREAALGRSLTVDEKAVVVDSLIRGFSVDGISLAKRGIFKERSIESVTNQLNEFYYSSTESILAYVHTANESIETNKFFGGKGSSSFSLATEDSVATIVAEMVENGEIDNKQAKILKDVLKARFDPARMGEVMSTIRDIGYITTMGSPLNAITQIGDLATSNYNSGLLNTAATIPSALLDKTQVTLKDIGIEDVAQEFDNHNKTASAVNTVFKATGLNKVDRVGKLTLVNSAIRNAQRKAKKGDRRLAAELELMFEGNADAVMQEFASGEITDNIKLFAFNKLLDFQPVALSEMPELYLTSSRGKMFYMLKTFTIKQLDTYRREVFTEINSGLKSGNKKQVAKGLGNFVKLASYWVVMGASADWLKDFVRSFFGDSEMEDPEDYVIENVYKAFGLSKYTFDQMAKPFGGSTPANAAFDLITPPTKTLNNMWRDYRDIEKNGWKSPDQLNSIRSVPVGGELYYFWFGGGAEKKSNKKKLGSL